jgi:2-isopropylmalate synthase
MKLEIYDCTLREGEQAHGASFNLNDRVYLSKLLDEFGVDYIELGWPMASDEIFNSFKEALNIVKRAKIVAFGSTSIKKDINEDLNLMTIVKTGVKYACIFGKTSIEHIEKQLKLSKEENLNKIIDSIAYLKNNGIEVFYDAEHYFDSYKENKEYTLRTLIAAIEGGAKRLILCDTRGGILPSEAEEIVKSTYEELKNKGFDFKLGVHFHNDSGLALANSLICLPYVKQVQGTINGIGERVGNLNFSEFLPVYIKKLNNKSNINLKLLKSINEEASRISGINMPEARPYIGEIAFAHKAGVHIDAHNKGASYEHENPEDFGNKRVIILNSLGGRGSVIKIAEEFGHILDKNDEKIKEKINLLFEELREHEKSGYQSGHLKAEQYLILRKFLKSEDKLFEILEWSINSEFMNNIEKSRFLVLVRLENETIEETMEVEGGPVDAAFKTLKKILSVKYPKVEELKLKDFHVSIARQKQEESAVRTKIDFIYGEEFSTVGVDSNILGSCIEALEKGFRYYLFNSMEEKVKKKIKNMKIF